MVYLLLRDKNEGSDIGKDHLQINIKKGRGQYNLLPGKPARSTF